MKKLSKIEQEVISWSNRFPVDSWWRKKHNIAFMSKAHREVSFLDQLFEYEEDKLIKRYENEKDDYVPNIGDFLRSEGDLDDKTSIQRLAEQFDREFLDGQDS